jgi:hypothetical protein
MQEGEKATEAFENLMRSLFRSPKGNSQKAWKRQGLGSLALASSLPLIGGVSLYPFRLADYK